ncbi:Pyruvate dehydrogenase phosphatase [Carabus blaptoides fortunei]
MTVHSYVEPYKNEKILKWFLIMKLYTTRRFHISHPKNAGFSKLSPQEVNSILRANEYSHEFAGTGSVRSYDCNQLASNNPIEDTRSEATCLLTTGLLLGVFDGHGGAACAQVVSKRLYKYISACLLPPDMLRSLNDSLHNESSLELIQAFNDKIQFVNDVGELYKISFKKFVQELTEVNYNGGFEMHKALEKAFLRLDEDLSKEAIPDDLKNINMKTLSVAMSGTVACVAHIDGPHLHVANVGDCNAVLGVLTETNSWIARKLTNEHNSYNQSEVERIIKEHPYNECDTVIKMERLLGQLAPLRSLGDFSNRRSLGYNISIASC